MNSLQKVLQGLQIFAKYGGGDIASGHDMIYAGPPAGVEMSEEDTKALQELGWFFENEWWSKYV